MCMRAAHAISMWRFATNSPSTAPARRIGHRNRCDQTQATAISGGPFTAALGGVMSDRTNEKEAAKGSGLVELSQKRR